MLCTSGLRWSACSYCFLQLRAQVLRALDCTFQCSRNEAFNVAVTSCFGSHSCAGLRILFAFCNSGLLRWFASSVCVLHLRVALVCVLLVFCNSELRWSGYSYGVLHLKVALVCVFLSRFATQGCTGLRILIVFLQSRVAPVCVFFLCFASQGCAGLRFLFVCCKSGLHWSARRFVVRNNIL